MRKRNSRGLRTFWDRYQLLTARLFAIVKRDPNTGKDALDHLITKTLGDSIDHSTLEELTGDYTFKNEPLLGKRAVIVSEKPEHTIKDAEALKRLVGGTILRVERKNKPAVELENNIIKLIVFANEIPTFRRIEDARPLTSCMRSALIDLAKTEKDFFQTVQLLITFWSI